MAPDVEQDILESVRMDRRGFVRKVVIGTAFATPLLASFDMRSMTAYAACLTANQTGNLQDDKFLIEIVGCTELDGGDLRIRLRVRDADSEKNVSRAELKVKLFDVDPDPGDFDLTKGFDLKSANDKPFYQLKIDVSEWAQTEEYRFFIRVGNREFDFSFVVTDP